MSNYDVDNPVEAALRRRRRIRLIVCLTAAVLLILAYRCHGSDAASGVAGPAHKQLCAQEFQGRPARVGAVRSRRQVVPHVYIRVVLAYSAVQIQKFPRFVRFRARVCGIRAHLIANSPPSRPQVCGAKPRSHPLSVNLLVFPVQVCYFGQPNVIHA
jgi:hypothetical protein